MAYPIAQFLSRTGSEILTDYVGISVLPPDPYGCSLLPLEVIQDTNSFSLNTKGYVQVNSSCLDHQDPWVTRNTKFQLHQLVAHRASIVDRNPAVPPEFANAFRRYFDEAAVQGAPWCNHELSHLCRNKNCTTVVHLWPEPSNVNKSRNYCQVVIQINGQLHTCCSHQPHVSERLMPSGEQLFTTCKT